MICYYGTACNFRWILHSINVIISFSLSSFYSLSVGVRSPENVGRVVGGVLGALLLIGLLILVLIYVQRRGSVENFKISSWYKGSAALMSTRTKRRSSAKDYSGMGAMKAALGEELSVPNTSIEQYSLNPGTSTLEGICTSTKSTCGDTENAVQLSADAARYRPSKQFEENVQTEDAIYAAAGFATEAELIPTTSSQEEILGHTGDDNAHKKGRWLPGVNTDKYVPKIPTICRNEELYGEAEGGDRSRQPLIRSRLSEFRPESVEEDIYNDTDVPEEAITAKGGGLFQQSQHNIAGFDANNDVYEDDEGIYDIAAPDVKVPVIQNPLLSDGGSDIYDETSDHEVCVAGK